MDPKAVKTWNSRQLLNYCLKGADIIVIDVFTDIEATCIPPFCVL